MRDLRDLLDFVVLIILEQYALGKNNVKLNSKNILFTTLFAKFYKFNILLAISNDLTKKTFFVRQVLTILKRCGMMIYAYWGRC